MHDCSSGAAELEGGAAAVAAFWLSRLRLRQIQYHPFATFCFISWKPVHAPYCNHDIK